MPSYAIVFFSRAFAKRLLDKRFPLSVTKASFPTTIFLHDRDSSFFSPYFITLARKKEGDHFNGAFYVGNTG